MRSVIALTAMMATAALAKPLQHAHYHEKRQDVVVVTDVVEATAVVTVYATATATSAVVDADSSSDAVDTTSLKTYTNKWGVHTWTWFHRSTAAASTTEEATSTPPATSAPVAPSTSVLTVVSSPTSVYVPPTSAAPVPTTPSTTAAPAPTSVAPTTLETSTIAAASSTTAAAATSYSDIALLHHNVHRANHSSTPAVWNITLASIAQEWAQSCNYSHNTQIGGGGYGQNIAGGVPANNISAVITDLFYNGEVNWYSTPTDLYGAASPDFTNFEHWGHFSQIVWDGSTSVGCYTADCSAQGYLYGLEGDNVPPYFTVCNYYPAGNMGGEYGANIGRPTSDNSVNWNYGL